MTTRNLPTHKCVVTERNLVVKSFLEHRKDISVIPQSKKIWTIKHVYILRTIWRWHKLNYASTAPENSKMVKVKRDFLVGVLSLIRL